jgi:formylglycine-generating enzyme required for sulfatase activity
MALYPGDTLLNGQYRILDLLGRGGFGLVYRAQDTLLSEQVAIKVLTPVLMGDEAWSWDKAILKRFLVEAKATMRLTHEHIVRTHNVFSEGGSYYIVMECMAGGSLEARLREERALPADECVRIASQVCVGLDYAHGLGVVHCDLKPANILFDAHEKAKVADFGIAHVSEEVLTRTWMTPAGFVAGTLPYISPEQADGVRDDPRVDVYSMGAMLYRMLTGQPYLDFNQRETPGAQADNVYRIRTEVPKPPSAQVSHLPSWLDDVVLKALDKEPEGRYQSAGQLGAALFHPQPPVQKTPLSDEVQPTSPPVGPPAVAAEARPARAVPAPEPAARPEEPARARRAPLPSRVWWLATAAILVAVLLVVAGILIGGGNGGGTTAPAESAEPTATAGAGSSQVWARDDSVMVHVPAGTFWMGSDARDLYASDDERPQHEVHLDAFWIDRSEVTNDMFGRFVADTGYETDAEERGSSWGYNVFTRRWGYVGGMDWQHPRGPATDLAGLGNHPVVHVSWNDAAAYCEWAGKRLPTEAEWEKAARGMFANLWPWGDTFDGTLLNFCDVNCVRSWKDEAWDDGYAEASPVGSYGEGASRYGVLDAVGNVWEWVADWYGNDYYAFSPEHNPQGPDSGVERVQRSGAWINELRDVRPTIRGRVDPSLSGVDVGFRCAR